MSDDKLIGKCSCIICKKTYSVHSFHTHYQRIHLKTQDNYKGKTEKASAVLQAKSRAKYQEKPNYCPQCNAELPYEKRTNRFCNSSCAGLFNNQRKDFTTFKSGPPKGSSTTSSFKTKPDHEKKQKSLKQCKVCGFDHYGSGKTCSKACQSIASSESMKLKIANGYNPQLNRSRNKRSYLERSFQDWLDKVFPSLQYIIEQPFKRLDMTKTYFADFFFPTKQLVIELDGSQHQYTVAYDKDRDNYISTHYGVQVIRITHAEYQDKSRIQEIVRLLS